MSLLSVPKPGPSTTRRTGIGLTPYDAAYFMRAPKASAGMVADAMRIADTDVPHPGRPGIPATTTARRWGERFPRASSSRTTGPPLLADWIAAIEREVMHARVRS